MSDILHKDLWYDILLRLPIKTLVICACTCKTFNSYITSPDFIAVHLTKSKDNPLVFLRYHAESEEYNGNQLFGLHPDDDDDDNDESSLKWDFNMRELPFQTYAPYLRILGSFNGVICLSDDLLVNKNVIYLWNPCIKKFIQLPRPNVTMSTHGAFHMCLGFGFDDFAFDFKVVRVAYLGGFENPPLVEVYSLKSGSWRYVENSSPKFVIGKVGYTQCFLNRAVHWLGHTCALRSRWAGIVTFNVLDESFGVMKLPVSLDGTCSITENLTITTSWGMLAVLHLHSENSSSGSPGYESCIWVMKDYGVVDSWIPYFTISHPMMGPTFKMITFRKNKDLIMLTRYDIMNSETFHVIQLVNRRRGVVENIGTYSGSLNGFYLDLYEESLALFNEGKPTFVDIIEHDDAEDDNVAANDVKNDDVTHRDVDDNNYQVE